MVLTCARVDTSNLSSAGHTTSSNRFDALAASNRAFFFAAKVASRSSFWISSGETTKGRNEEKSDDKTAATVSPHWCPP